MKKFAVTIPDWQTAVAAAAIAGIVIFGCRALWTRYQPVAPERPVANVQIPKTDANPLIFHLSSTPIDGSTAGTFGSGGRPSPEKISLEQQKSGHSDAALAMQQLDYESFRTMQTQIITSLRKQIREHGVGPDGVTEADLDRMLKNGQMPW